MFYSDTDTSTHTIDFDASPEGFNTSGINGYGFWFPVSPLSGKLENCNIVLDEYENVKRNGLPSPGGVKRYYFESMNGYGEYFPEIDSIYLFINYSRTGDFPHEFSGNIYFVKE